MSNWPTSISTNANLYVAVDYPNSVTFLSGTITSSATTITVANATNYPSSGGFILIDSELITYTGISSNNLTGCTRGVDGTSASSHTNGSVVNLVSVAEHHNALKNEVIAIETYLSTYIGESGIAQTLTPTATPTFAGVVLTDTEITPKTVTVEAPSTLTSTWALHLPISAGSTGQFLQTDGSGNTSWQNVAGSGTINSGTQYQLTYYGATGTTLSGNPNTMLGTQVVVTDSHGVPTTTGNGGTTATEIGYVHGVTSSIQPQLTAISAVANAALPESGGTMTGTINMGSNKITSLANGSLSADAVAYGQISTSGLAVNVPTKLAYSLSTPLNTGSGHVLVKFDTQLFDALSEYNPSTGLFTPLTTGFYYISASLDFDSYQSGDTYAIEIYDNTAATIVLGSTVGNNSSGLGDMGLAINVLCSLNSTHSYAIRAFIPATPYDIRGGAASFGVATFLSIHRVF